MTKTKNTPKKKKIKVTGLNYNDIKYDEELYLHDNGLQKCSICGWNIPADIQRHRFQWSGFQQSATHTICAFCLLQMAKQIKNRKKVNKLIEERLEAILIEQL